MCTLCRGRMSQIFCFHKAEKFIGVYGNIGNNYRTSYEDRRPSVVQELKIKTAYQLTQGQNNMDIIKNIENTESSNFFTAREFLIKMKNIPHFKGMGFC